MMSQRLPGEPSPASLKSVFCPAPRAWLAGACALALAVLWSLAAGVRAHALEACAIAGVALVLLVIAFVYARLRPAPALAASASAAAFLIFFSAAGAALSYAGAWLGAPLRDEAFAAADAALGFDWNAHLAFVAQRPALAAALTWAYFSCQAQLILVIFLLAARDRAALSRFMSLYAATGLATIALAAALPALGAYAHHAPPAELAGRLPDSLSGRWHMSDFVALREGRFLDLRLSQVEGLISFPSFHTALAILFVHAFWRAPWLRAPALFLNGTMIVSTLAIGGHFLVDVIAGAAIAGAAICAARLLERGPRARRTSYAGAAAEGGAGGLALDPCAPRG
jgi:membrane-associated phospholipid phosphatase